MGHHQVFLPRNASSNQASRESRVLSAFGRFPVPGICRIPLKSAWNPVPSWESTIINHYNLMAMGSINNKHGWNNPNWSLAGMIFQQPSMAQEFPRGRRGGDTQFSTRRSLDLRRLVHLMDVTICELRESSSSSSSNYIKLHEITWNYIKLHEIMHQFIRIHTHQWENSTWFDHSAFVSCPVCCLLPRLELRKDILPQLQPVGRGNCWGRKTYLLQPPDVRNKLEVSMMLMGKSCIHGDCTSVFH